MPTIDDKKNKDKFLEIFKENFEDHHLILENQKRIEDKLDRLLNARGKPEVDWGSI